MQRLTAAAPPAILLRMSKNPARPEYHAFAAIFPETGSAIQGTGPTADAALEEATAALGSADGLEVYPTGPRLAALLALGAYELTTRFCVERRMSAPARVELDRLDEAAELLADVRVAYATGRNLWSGRDWTDAERICSDWTDEQIVRAALAAKANGEQVEVTRWGIPEDDSRESQRWLERRDAAARRLLAAVASAGDILRFDENGVAVVDPEADIDRLRDEQVEGPRDAALECDNLRELAQESDDAVAESAALAEALALDSYRSALAGELEAALEEAREAAALERGYGDAPTWGALLAAVEALVEVAAE